jgi:hypothetical protein
MRFYIPHFDTTEKAFGFIIAQIYMADLYSFVSDMCLNYCANCIIPLYKL